MNIRDLQYIASIAKNKNFAKAANQCFVSQPALSMQVKKLEDELGVKIFERGQKSLLITAVGEAILSKAEVILREVNEIKAIAKNNKDLFAGEVRIGGFPTLAPYFFPEFIACLHKKFPKLKIFLIEEKSAELVRRLENGQLDCIFLAEKSIDEAASKLIFSEEFLLAVPKNHELANLTKSKASEVKIEKNLVNSRVIELSDLKNRELMLLEDGHCLRSQALEVCALGNLVEMEGFRASSLETLRQMVASGNGITFIPEIAIRADDKKNSKISYLRIANAPRRLIYLHWRKNSAKEKLIEKISHIAANPSKNSL